MQRLADCYTDWAARTPDHVAITDEQGSWSYADLARRVDETAAWLRDLGVRPGDRLGLIGENGAALAALILAAGRIDAWAVLENARRAAPEVDDVRRRAGARRTLYVVGNSTAAAGHAQRHGAQPHDSPLGELAAGACDPAAVPEPVFEDPRRQVAALIYTTGSTGVPKGVMLTHANLLYIGALMRSARKLTPEDKVYGVLPITHVMGLSSGLVGTLSAGAHINLVPRFSVTACHHALRHDGITILQGAPAMFARLLAGLPAEGPVAPHLRFIAVGGAPLDPALKTAAEDALGLTMHNGYGLTEASACCWTRLELDNPDCAVGPPNPGTETRILGPDGAEVVPGAVGELWVRGPTVMRGYYQAPELTAKVLTPDAWFNTEDLARQMPDGRIHIVGRTKDLIIRSGFNVSPLEIETALNAHPGVQVSAVLGRAANGTEEIVAVLEPVPGKAPTEEDLLAFLNERLAPYKRPSKIVFVRSLPVAPNGKVLKHQLREHLEELL